MFKCSHPRSSTQCRKFHSLKGVTTSPAQRGHQQVDQSRWGTQVQWINTSSSSEDSSPSLYSICSQRSEIRNKSWKTTFQTPWTQLIIMNCLRFCHSIAGAHSSLHLENISLKNPAIHGCFNSTYCRFHLHFKKARNQISCHLLSREIRKSCFPQGSRLWPQQPPPHEGHRMLPRDSQRPELGTEPVGSLNVVLSLKFIHDSAETLGKESLYKCGVLFCFSNFGKVTSGFKTITFCSKQISHFPRNHACLFLLLSVTWTQIPKDASQERHTTEKSHFSPKDKRCYSSIFVKVSTKS